MVCTVLQQRERCFIFGIQNLGAQEITRVFRGKTTFERQTPSWGVPRCLGVFFDEDADEARVST